MLFLDEAPLNELMYIGVCLLFCNPSTIVFSLFAMVMLHLQILQEEKYLTAVFGAPYTEYKSKVFRYLGRRQYAGRAGNK